MMNTAATWTIASSAGGNIQGHSPAVDLRKFCDAVRKKIRGHVTSTCPQFFPNILEIATLPSVARDDKNVVKACGKNGPII